MNDKQQILNKTITITGIAIKETKNGAKYALKDHEGRTFDFFTTKQDGTDTSAFAPVSKYGLEDGRYRNDRLRRRYFSDGRQETNKQEDCQFQGSRTS